MNHEKLRRRHDEKLITRHMLNNEDRRKTIKQLYLKTTDINSFEDCCRLRYGSSRATFSFFLLLEPLFYFFSLLRFHLIGSECPSRIATTGCYQSAFCIQYPPSALLTLNNCPYPSLFFYLLHGEFYIYLSLIPFSCLLFPYSFSFMCLHAILDIVFAY